MWMTLKCLERSTMWLPCERNCWKTLILETPHHFLTMYTWDFQMKRILNDIQRCLNHVYLLEQLKITGLGKTSRTNSSAVLRHGGTRSKMRWATLRIGKKKKWSNCTTFQVLAWMTINANRKNLNQLENCQKFARKLSENACTWHELDDLTFHGLSTSLQDQSQNGLRHVTDAWQGWFLTFITHDFGQYCHVGNTAQHCRLSLFQDSDFAGEFEDSKSTSRGVLCIFGRRTFVPVRWMCKEQTSVSHSSTESEINYLDYLLSIFGTSWLRYYVQPTTLSNTTIMASTTIQSHMVLCIFGSRTFVPISWMCAQFHRIWNHFSGSWIRYGWVFCSRSLGHSDWSVTTTRPNQNIQATRKLGQCLIPKPRHNLSQDAPKLLKSPKSECPDIWNRLPRHKWPKSWSSMEDPVVPFWPGYKQILRQLLVLRTLAVWRWYPWLLLLSFVVLMISLFGEYCVRPRIVFHNIASEYNSTFVFLVLCLQFGILQMTDVHQWGKMNFCALRPCFIGHLWFTSEFCQVPRRNFLQFFPFLIHRCFCCRNFHSLRHRNKFVNQITMLQTQNNKRRKKIDQLSDVDYVPTNAHSSQGESQLYISEDGEAVIKGRSPTVTRVKDPQTCSWLVVRQNQVGTQELNMLTPETNPADILKEVSHETNGIIFFVFFNIMSFSIFLVAISAPCQKEVKKRLQMKALRW